MLTYLTFILDNSVYAINAVNVINIHEEAKITKVPLIPDDFAGIVNLRGMALPVLDIRKRLTLITSDIDSDNSIIVIQIPNIKTDIVFGGMVDEVIELKEINEKDIQPPPKSLEEHQLNLIDGLYWDNDKPVFILKITKLLSAKLLDSFNQEMYKYLQ